MAVYTIISRDELCFWLKNYPVGELLSFEGIAEGITNTNYFVRTSTGDYVLTLCETLRVDELPYYVNLVVHLAQQSVLVAQPIARKDGAFVDTLLNKPTALMTALKGHTNVKPTNHICHRIGRALAYMHQCGQSFKEHRKSSRGRDWFEATANKLYPELSQDEAILLREEIKATAKLSEYTLPEGVVHADLFRDNVLMDGENISGFIDFYYACHGILLFDIAVTINDWCIDTQTNLIDALKIQALLTGYQELRPLTGDEIEAMPLILRNAALRFWLSRLYDSHFPVVGPLSHIKDPDHFKQILLQHKDQR